MARPSGEIFRHELEPWCLASEPEAKDCLRLSSLIGPNATSRRSSSALTASNTVRASSCDTRSRIAPHSTSVRPGDRLDRDVPPIARDPLRAILEAASPDAPRRRGAAADS